MEAVCSSEMWVCSVRNKGGATGDWANGAQSRLVLAFLRLCQPPSQNTAPYGVYESYMKAACIAPSD
jgi:hypothetical protein